MGWTFSINYVLVLFRGSWRAALKGQVKAVCYHPERNVDIMSLTLLITALLSSYMKATLIRC